MLKRSMNVSVTTISDLNIAEGELLLDVFGGYVHVETVDERQRDHHQQQAVEPPANVGHFAAGRW